MPKITRYGHERRGNVKVAPDFLTPDVVGRLIGFCGLQPYQRQFLRNIGVDLASGPDMAVEAAYEVTESGKTALKEVKETSSKNTPGASGTACPAPSVASSGATSRRSARAPQKINGRNGTVIIDEFASLYANEVKVIDVDQLQKCSNSTEDGRGRAGDADTKGRSGREGRPCGETGAVSGPSGSTDPAGPEIAPLDTEVHKNGHDTRSKGQDAPLARDWYVRRHEVLADATRFLKARCILVDVVDRGAQIRKYRVSGKREAMFLEDVVALAESLGFEGAAA